MLFAQCYSPVSNLVAYLNDVGVSARDHSGLRSALDAPDQVCYRDLISLVEGCAVFHLSVQSQGPALHCTLLPSICNAMRGTYCIAQVVANKCVRTREHTC